MRKVAFIVFTFVVVSLLGRLGFWQLSRGEAKQALQQHIADSTEITPLADLAQLPTDPLWHPVQLSGQFDTQHPILLDNQLNNGQVGYHLYLPFFTQERWLLVNLGWLPAPQYRDQWPTLPSFIGQHHIVGTIAPTSSLLQLQPEQPNTQWPQRVQNIDLIRLSAQLEREFPAWVIQISPLHPVALQQNWTPVVMKADKHYGYAMQWFLLAFAVLGCAGWWLLKEKG